MSVQPIDAGKAELSENNSDRRAGAVSIVEIEIEGFLLRRERNDPKHLVIEFLDDEDRAREIFGTAILLPAEVSQTSPAFGKAEGNDALFASRFLISFQ
jgi:hypothetical protein